MGTVLGIVIAVVVVGYAIFWLWMLYEIGSRPEVAYEDAGESKAVWFLLVLVLQFFGTLAYFFMVRSKLLEAEKKALPQVP